ncbi:hypothetical protein NDU88_000911 [Pleurodeles waltl]|uniref:Uncharacterized protein n=1 Tax=Pleurodeles waltl TaxID=8319 RepID=A0AAV7N9C0_PLEWA|nr:hypothetical protein NDU88_000911 [Pleurodeles waltl]
MADASLRSSASRPAYRCHLGGQRPRDALQVTRPWPDRHRNTLVLRAGKLGWLAEELGWGCVGQRPACRAKQRCGRAVWRGARSDGEAFTRGRPRGGALPWPLLPRWRRGCARRREVRRAGVLQAAWEWLESTGRISSCAAERNVPVLGSKHNRARRTQKRGEVRAGPVARAPDLEHLMQEKREAIHSAAAIIASPLVSESESEVSQPPSNRPITPDRLSELGLVEGPPVTPATADELF